MPHVPPLPSATPSPEGDHNSSSAAASTPIPTATFQLINFHPEALEGPEELGDDFSSRFSSLSWREKNHTQPPVPPR